MSLKLAKWGSILCLYITGAVTPLHAEEPVRLGSFFSHHSLRAWDLPETKESRLRGYPRVTKIRIGDFGNYLPPRLIAREVLSVVGGWGDQYGRCRGRPELGKHFVSIIGDVREKQCALCRPRN